MQVIARNHEIDILVTRPEGTPLLAVEVKRLRFYHEARRQLEQYSQTLGAEFVMAVDPEQIVTAPTLSGLPQWEHAITLSTSEILRHYADVPDLERIEGFYLESLVEAWLRDFSFSWKSTRPSGYEELEEIGLASRLRHSETYMQRYL
jgi:hypothetical protein